MPHPAARRPISGEIFVCVLGSYIAMGSKASCTNPLAHIIVAGMIKDELGRRLPLGARMISLIQLSLTRFIIGPPNVQHSDERLLGWSHSKKTGWANCELPPGQAKKYGCRTCTHQGRYYYYYQELDGRAHHGMAPGQRGAR